MKKITKLYLALTGILLVGLGIVCVAHPGATLLSAAWLIGLLTFVSGVFTLCYGLSAHSLLPNAGSVTLSGIVQLLIGLFFLTNEHLLAASLPIVFAVWVIFESVTVALRSFDYRRVGFPLWWLALLLGIGGAVLGFMALRTPASTATLLSTLIGCGVIASGVTRLVALLCLRRFEQAARRWRNAGRETVDVEAEEV